MGQTRINTEAPTVNTWELTAPLAKRDLIIRKIFTTILFSINIAGLGAALYFVIAYCPISAKAYVISPFIVGVLGAVAYLKLPTFGISKFNYHNITNPAVQLGKGLALAFFTPCVLASYLLDQTPYHDPHSANCISTELSEWTFSQISEKHGRHFNNLYRYGFIREEDVKKEDLKNLREELLPIEREMSFYEKKYASVLKGHVKSHKRDHSSRQPEWFNQYLALKEQKEGKEGVEDRWKGIRARLIDHLPHPEIPADDFSTRWGRFRVTAREFFLNTNDFFPKSRASNMGDLLA